METTEIERDKSRIIGECREWLGWRAGRACSSEFGCCDDWTLRWLDVWRLASCWSNARDVARLYISMELARQRGIASGELCHDSFKPWEIERCRAATARSVWRNIAHDARTAGDYPSDHATARAVYRIVTYWRNGV